MLEDKNGTESVLDKGYLLSPRDLCSLDTLPTLVKLGINSFKIEGRMKTPEYVATVTKIYRKYLKGNTIDELTKEYFLSEKSIRRIINKQKQLCS